MDRGAARDDDDEEDGVIISGAGEQDEARLRGLRAEFQEACAREGVERPPAEVARALCLVQDDNGAEDVEDNDDDIGGDSDDENGREKAALLLDNSKSLDARVVRSLCAISSLRVLDLRDCPLSPDAVRVLGDPRATIETLALTGCLDATQAHESLEGLAEGLEACSRAPRLSTLELGQCSFAAAGVPALRALTRRVLPRLSQLRSLRLSSCDLVDDAVEELCGGLFGLCRLAHLDLSSNAFGPRGAKAVAQLFDRGTPLRALSLADNGLGSRGFETIVTAAHRAGALRLLDASRNGIPCVAAVRSLSEYLQDNMRCTLETIKLQDCATAVDARCVELLGAALAANGTVREIDLRSARHAAICDAPSLAAMADCLGTNSALVSVQLGRIDERVMSQAESRDALAPLRRILVLNTKLSALVRNRTHQARAASAERCDRSGARSPRRSVYEEERPDSTPRRARHMSEPASLGAAQMVDEIKAALRAVRGRTETHHAEIEDRVSGRLFELDSRVSMVMAAPIVTKEARRQPWNEVAARRLDAVESKLQQAGEQTSRLNEFTTTLREQVSDMASSLALYAPGQGDKEGDQESRLADRVRLTEQRIARVLDRAFGDAEQEVAQLQRTFSHDFEKKQDMWRQRLEGQLAQVVSRIDLLEQSVITLHDENILALETILQDRRQRARRASSSASARSNVALHSMHR